MTGCIQVWVRLGTSCYKIIERPEEKENSSFADREMRHVLFKL